MQSANLSGPLKGLRPHQALIGPTQASGLAGGFDLPWQSEIRDFNVCLYFVVKCFEHEPADYSKIGTPVILKSMKYLKKVGGSR